MAPTMSMRLPCLVLLAALVAGAPLTAHAENTASAGGAKGALIKGNAPKTLEELGSRIVKLEERISNLIAYAKRDPAQARIEQYVAYRRADFKNRKRAVRAHMLVSYMADATKDKDVRELAYKTLVDAAMRGDPDLSQSLKRGRVTERAYFAQKHLVDLLKADDLQTREYANMLLDSWFRVRGVGPILAYRTKDPKTWSKAIKAWKRELKKKA